MQNVRHWRYTYLVRMLPLVFRFLFAAVFRFFHLSTIKLVIFFAVPLAKTSSPPVRGFIFWKRGVKRVWFVRVLRCIFLFAFSGRRFVRLYFFLYNHSHRCVYANAWTIWLNHLRNVFLWMQVYLHHLFSWNYFRLRYFSKTWSIGRPHLLLLGQRRFIAATGQLLSRRRFLKRGLSDEPSPSLSLLRNHLGFTGRNGFLFKTLFISSFL